jgi:peptidoglycan hydrolase CwlO-like protein
MTNENDLSLRLSQFTVMDATKDKLSSKLRSIEDNNEELREALRVAEGQTNKLKIKASEAERLEYQVREARKEAENKMKAMERKDKRIIFLEE